MGQIIKCLHEAQYHADPAIGSTTAKLMLDSPRLFKDAIDGVYRVEDKPHYQIGRLIHMMVLEPGRYNKCVVSTGPINAKTGKEYGRDTKAFQEWQSENPHLTVVEPWIHTAISRMPTGVAALFESDGDSELSFFAEIDSIRVKCRADRFPSNSRYFYDLKTIAGGKGDIKRSIDKQIQGLKYWFSGGWYRKVIHEVTGEYRTPMFIFCEKAPPYRWIIVDLDFDYMAHAEAEVDRVIDEINWRENEDKWDDEDISHTSTAPPYLVEAFTESEDGSINL